MIPSTLDHLTAVRDALPGTVYLVDVPASAQAPYTFVGWTGGGLLDGPVGAPDDDGEMPIQVTYVGTGPEQAEWMRDRGRAALVGRETITVEGRLVWRVSLEMSQTSQRDNTVQPPLFYAVDRCRIYTTEAS